MIELVNPPNAMAAFGTEERLDLLDCVHAEDNVPQLF